MLFYSFCMYTKSEQYLITGTGRSPTGPFKFSTARAPPPNDDRQTRLSVFDKRFYSTRVRYTTRFCAFSTPHVIRVSDVQPINNKMRIVCDPQQVRTGTECLIDMTYSVRFYHLPVTHIIRGLQSWINSWYGYER